MSEKMERRIKIGLNCFAIFALILLIVTLWSHSQYTANEHSMEQGHLPVYVAPPSLNGGTTANGEPEDFFANFDSSLYKPMSYEKVLTACEKVDGSKIKIQGTVYSSLETASSVIYNIADADGNCYSIVDQSNGQLPKLAKTKVIIVYGSPKGLSKMNNESIPQLNAAFFEETA